VAHCLCTCVLVMYRLSASPLPTVAVPRRWWLVPRAAPLLLLASAVLPHPHRDHTLVDPASPDRLSSRWVAVRRANLCHR
jgi:hypothetical protein